MNNMAVLFYQSVNLNNISVLSCYKKAGINPAFLSDINAHRLVRKARLFTVQQNYIMLLRFLNSSIRATGLTFLLALCNT